MAEDDLGENLKLARRVAGLSQQAVADRVGVTRVTVADWERGAATPRDENLAALARLFGKTVAQLRHGEPPMSTGSVHRDEEARSAATPSRVHPQRVRVWLADFRAELTRAGATDDEIAEAMDLLQAPQLFVFYAGGKPREMTEEQMVQGLEALATVIRRELRKRGRKFA